MTNKSLLGLVGGGSAAAGLGTGFGVGIKTQPYDYEDFMNFFYASLIKDANKEVEKYDSEKNEEVKTKILKNYMEYVCDVITKMPESYEWSESAKQQKSLDEVLCNNSSKNTGFESHKHFWVTHLQNRPQNLKKERDEFKKYIYEKSTTSSQ